MATKIFRWRGSLWGGNGTSWQDSLNWVDGSGEPYGTGIFPGSIGEDSDHVFFDEKVYWTEGQTELNVSPDLSTFAQNTTLESLYIGPEYNGYFIGSSNEIDVNKVILNTSSMPLSQGLILSGGVVGDLLVRDATVALELKGTYRNVTFYKAESALFSTASVDNLFVYYNANKATDCDITVSYATILNYLYQYGGKVTIDSNPTDSMKFLFDGTLTLRSGTVPTLVQSGGICNWENGSISLARIDGGVFDGSKTSHIKTLDKMRVGPLGRVNLDDKVGNIQITTGVSQNGGTVYWPNGIMLKPV